MLLLALIDRKYFPGELCPYFRQSYPSPPQNRSITRLGYSDRKRGTISGFVRIGRRSGRERAALLSFVNSVQSGFPDK